MTDAVIILAAGHGTRMGNTTPKVLQTLGDRPLLAWVLDTAGTLDNTEIHVVVHPEHELVQSMVMERGAAVCQQAEQLGTAHAVQCADKALDAERVLVLYGDVPLVQKLTLQSLLAQLEQSELAVLTAVVDDPTGYGRIVRDNQGQLCRIVEQCDASADEEKIQEISTGIFAAKGSVLRRLISQVNPDNAQHEYYLTDCVGLAVQENLLVQTQKLSDFSEAQGINTLVDLERAERLLQLRLADELMQAGCLIRDKSRLDIRGTVSVGRSVEIDVNVVLEGKVALGDGVRIGANCVLKDVTVQAGTVVKPFSMIEASQIGKSCTIGPFARIRPEVELGDHVKVGNYVEIKKSVIGQRSKVNHLSYIGDSTIGRDVNIGAGTITCNYDGDKKHHTVIGDDVFVGSGTQIVAPVTIHKGATIGAGSTITRDAESGKLTLSRSEQKTVDHWKRAGRVDK